MGDKENDMSTVLLAFLLALFTGLIIVFVGLGVNMWSPLFMGVVAGLIVGDVGLGLKIGATCSLMALGFYSYGGATQPDYMIGAIFGVFVASRAGSVDQGLVVAAALAMFMVLFDILGRMTTTVFQHACDNALAKRNLKTFSGWFWMGTLPWFLSRFIPVFVGMLLIDKYAYIQKFIEQYAWFRQGLQVIGAALPAVGFALLLSYMNLKKYWPYMLVGYVLFAYMGVPTIGLAIIGVAAAGLYMMGRKNKSKEA